MTFEELRDKLLIEDGRFIFLNQNSMLGILLNNILNVINSSVEQYDLTQQRDILRDIDFINISNTELDNFAKLLGIERLYKISNIMNDGFYIASSVKLQVRDLDQTFLHVIQETYGSLTNIPPTLTCQTSDGAVTVKVVMPTEWSVEMLQSRVLILDAYISNLFLAELSSQSELTFVDSVLGYYLTALLTLDPLTFAYIEDDESLKYRIITSRHLLHKSAWTPDLLKAELLALLQPALRDIVIKPLARGVGTADVIIYPSSMYVYDQHYNFVDPYVPLLWQLKELVYRYVPLGIDIDIKDAVAVPFKFVIKLNNYSALSEEDKDAILTVAKTTAISKLEQFADLTIYQDVTIQFADILDEILNSINELGITEVNIANSYVADENGVMLNEVTLSQGSYPAVLSVAIN